MPLSPPELTAGEIEDLRFQVNETIRELSDLIESIYGVDEKQFVSQNNINMNNHRIIGLPEPVNDDDAVNKRFLDSNSRSFSTIECQYGTDPVADAIDNTLRLYSSVGSILVRGRKSDDSITFDASPLLYAYKNIRIPGGQEIPATRFGDVLEFYSSTGNIVIGGYYSAGGFISLDCSVGSFSAAGDDTEVQFNDDGEFGGHPGFRFYKSTGNLTVDAIPTEDHHVVRRCDITAYWPMDYWPNGYWP